jgi:hypothetical protein
MEPGLLEERRGIDITDAHPDTMGTVAKRRSQPQLQDICCVWIKRNSLVIATGRLFYVSHLARKHCMRRHLSMIMSQNSNSAIFSSECKSSGIAVFLKPTSNSSKQLLLYIRINRLLTVDAGFLQLVPYRQIGVFVS